MEATKSRYFWSSDHNGETTYALIDRVSSQPIATIIYLKSVRRWQWSRRTTVLLHGVAPAEGTAKLLSDAKQLIEAGLPQEM